MRNSSSLDWLRFMHTPNDYRVSRKSTILSPVLQGITKKKSLNNLLIIKGFICDPGAIQTHDLQNRNLTLYSLSYGAILSKCEDKSIKNLLIFLMILLFL